MRDETTTNEGAGMPLDLEGAKRFVEARSPQPPGGTTMSADFEIIGPLDIAIQALRDIADPVSALLRDAKANVYEIDGRAAVDLARKALADLNDVRPEDEQ